VGDEGAGFDQGGAGPLAGENLLRVPGRHVMQLFMDEFRSRNGSARHEVKM